MGAPIDEEAVKVFEPEGTFPFLFLPPGQYDSENRSHPTLDPVLANFTHMT